MYDGNIVWTGSGITVDNLVRLERDMMLDYAHRLEKYGGLFGEVAERLKSARRDGEVVRADHRSIQVLKDEAHASTVAQIGGSPAISALASYHFDSRLPVYFAGNKPVSVTELLRGTQFAERVIGYHTVHRPETFSIEDSMGLYKLMISDREGRSLKEQVGLADTVRDLTRGKSVLAFGGINKVSPQDYAAFIDQVKGNSILYIGTNSLTVKNAAEVGDVVLPRADIMSFNEEELRDIGKALSGKDDSAVGHLEYMGRVYKDKLLLVHSAGGAIATGKNIPEMDFMLRMAANAATYSYLTGEHAGRDQLADYGNGCNDELFAKTMGEAVGRLPKMMVGVASVKVEVSRGYITGAGARFDGVLAAELAEKLWR